ncbi:class I SAM-dependent RNA methyltransferase [Boseongicola aestuarii]|uniref:23S rRNA (Uracil(1939)-C(5))-methyltransferase RlmD n=1 Tax=Boseongicola aestuarii TaxID=1470561 RepID=A0A238J2R3_9RHOB|nr:RsmD family RNA methyltransferase [Boseongicola aestuarii]SMX24956.1 23S rRNA (uracil(1939)-C(5))-methyltransferase RlmD [Boseongicola aestuarii]
MTTVTIERLGLHGDGIASGPVYVARTLPGETVEGTLEGSRLTAPRIVTPSLDRISPKCRHYKSCGGCALQHASDGFVVDWQKDVVSRALEAVGLKAPIRNLHTSPTASRRRATLTGRRTKKGALVGFHGPASDTLIAVPDCQVMRPALLAALPALEEITSLAASRKSALRLSVTDTDTGLDVLVSAGKPLENAMQARLIDIANAAGFARISWDDDVIIQRVAPVLQMGTAPVPIPPGAFLQATAEGEAALLASVQDALGDARKVLDLFAGCGTFALPLSLGAEVHAVESEQSLLGALDAGWRHSKGCKRVTTERRDLFRRPLTPDELKHYDAIVIDPPRAGAEAQMSEIAAAQVQRIASVSCNPVTFAQDAAILTNSGYKLDWIDIVDQFRWSTHIEIAAGLTLV